MKKSSLFFALVLVLSCFGSSEAREKVFLLFSYHPGYSWVKEEAEGVDSVFMGRELQVERFYMDTKRKTGLYRIKAAADAAIARIEEFKPGLVMVFDDNACEFVAKRYAGKRLPFVFCGMNAMPSKYGFPAGNITGVLERELFVQGVRLLKGLVPASGRIAVITDDSPTSRGAVSQIKKAGLPSEITEIYATNEFDLWKAKVKALQGEVDAIGLLGYQTLRQKPKGESIPQDVVLRWTLRNSRLPGFAVNEFSVRAGVLCGVTQSGFEQGKAAAGMALEILDGKRPSDIPIFTPEKGISIINEKRACNLGIEIPERLKKGVLLVGECPKR